MSMNQDPRRNSQDTDALTTAVGLVWGWLDQGDPAQALTLVRGCLACWPGQAVLHLLHRHCLVELGQPLPTEPVPGASKMPPAWAALQDKLQARQRMRLQAEAGRGAPRRTAPAGQALFS